MKIAVIGGGSTYTPELVNGFLARVDTLLSRLWLMDIDKDRGRSGGSRKGQSRRAFKVVEHEPAGHCWRSML
jgi:alpha-galactosidase/6-phospho-beta-glucosidase family protein